MRFHDSKIPKVEAACSTDTERPVLMVARLDTDLQELQATDSYIAVRVPVHVDKGDTTGAVTPDALAALRKQKGKGLRLNGKQEVMPETWIPDDAKGKVKPVVALPRPEPAGQAPKLAAVWPAPKQIADGFRIGFNALYLKRVADALGATDGMIELIFPAFDKSGAPQALRPMVVRAKGKPVDGDRPKGAVSQPEALIMPIRLDPSQPPPSAPAKRERKPKQEATPKPKPKPSGRRGGRQERTTARKPAPSRRAATPPKMRTVRVPRRAVATSSLTPAAAKRAATMREKGKTFREIAAALGISEAQARRALPRTVR